MSTIHQTDVLTTEPRSFVFAGNAIIFCSRMTTTAIISRSRPVVGDFHIPNIRRIMIVSFCHRVSFTDEIVVQ